MPKKIINTCLLASLYLLISCGAPESRGGQAPANILSEEAFTNLLVDFSLAESAANINIRNAPVMKLDSVYAFDPLKENHVRKGQYDSTLIYYSNNSEQYKRIYENVLARLIDYQTNRSATKDSAGK